MNSTAETTEGVLRLRRLQLEQSSQQDGQTQ
jgi:hypothetical protein